MASTIVRTDACPAWVQRLRNWLIDGQYARLEWKTDAPEPTFRYRLHVLIESLGESLLCAIFGPEPVSQTDHDIVDGLLLAVDLRAEDRSIAAIR